MVMIFEPMCGTYISTACEKAVELANSSKEIVYFVFNDLQMIANPGDDSIKLTEEWLSRDQKRRDDYWTPERLQEKLDKESQDVLNLLAHYKTLSEVNLIEDLIRWFCKLETVSFTYALLNSKQRTILNNKCSDEFGIYAGMNCSDESPKGDWDNQTREYKLKWLAGQALDNTLSMGCPHGVIHSFAKKFGLL
jgi:hypothetical protein